MRRRAYVLGIALAAGIAAASAATLRVAVDTGGDEPGTVIVDAGGDPSKPLVAIKATKAPAPDAATATLPIIRHDIAVTTVDATASQPNNSHTGVPNQHLTLVPQNSSARKGRLFVFILGTNSSEQQEQEIPYAGVNHAYHALTVAYPNTQAVAMLCLGVVDTNCTGKVREEMLTGANKSNRIAVALQNAFETRLQKLLIYLRTNYPSEGWGGYLIGNAIDWSKISAAGHSQGAGHVAYLAKLHPMYRATMISGVADKTLAGATAPWLSMANQTPAASQYGFSHTADAVVTIATAEASWNAIGLAQFGAIQSVDSQGPNYAGSHKLSTARTLPAGVNAHLAMADDDKLPRDANGVPVWEPVWAFMALP